MAEKLMIAIEEGGKQYPQNNGAPGFAYPEYPWEEEGEGGSTNEVYKAVRNCLHDLKFDNDNFGKKCWNPLGDIIKPGNTVLLKPNLVVSDHPDLECIVTNPSVVRAMIDYVCIALKGTGRIVVGDAPMQRCDFSELLRKTKYKEIIDFYKEKGIDVEFVDFRNFISDYSTNEVRILKNDHEISDNYISVDLKEHSLHCPKDVHYKRYRVTNYDYKKMRKYHNPRHHIYLIRKEVLEADVIINMPKPKTHRKAGFTGALKNFVGSVVHKECLPHHIRGSVTFGGDEYLYPDFNKCARTWCYERIDLANIYDRRFFLPLYKRLLAYFDNKVSKKRKDNFSEGSWYGNDTIWRTFCDINRIIKYADKSGQMHVNPQRAVLTVADMIISGEKDGPVHASRKEVGKIVAGFNPVAVDMVICKMMGFDYKKIPALAGIISAKADYPLISQDVVEIQTKIDGKCMDYKDFNLSFDFIPTKGWMGHINS